MTNLLVIKGGSVGVKYPLENETTIGRAPENTIQIFDSNISRCHCEIVRQGRSFKIYDKESRNGLLINGRKEKEKTLLRNDEIVIGSTTFLFDTDRDLKNTRFSNKRVYFSSPTDDTIVHPQSRVAEERRSDQGRNSRRVEADRDLLCRLADIFTSSSSLPLPEALEGILQTLMEIFSSSRGCLMEWDRVLGDFVPAVVISDGDEYHISQSMIRGILEEKRSVLLPATAPANDSHRSENEPNTALCVPLKKGSDVNGLLCLEVDDPDQILLHDVQLLQSVATLTQLAIDHSRALDELEIEKARSRPKRATLIGASPAFTRSIDLIDRVADTRSTVLVTGETGTGKEVVSQEIHRLSPRAKYPFVAINCGAIPESLIEGELFGHERGAFTGADHMRRGLIETAHGGTLLLDEIGEMAPMAQTKLLRFLQDRVITRVGGCQAITVDVRVIAATNIDLAEAVRAKRFREDLWYRLNVFEIRLPPLRDRQEDIGLLADHFLRHYAREYNKPVRALSDDTLRMLESHHWPGNIRELQNAIERAILMCDGPMLAPEYFSVPWGARPNSDAAAPPPGTPEAEPTTLADAEKNCIRQALESCEWNQVQAAQRLRIHRNTLRKKITAYDLEPES